VHFPFFFFRSQVFQLAFLFVLALSVAMAPDHLVALQAASATTSETTASPAVPQHEAAQTQEEQNNAFRTEGPIVKATAATLHISPEAAARLFEIINFSIIVLAIGIPLIRFMPKFIRNRGEKVRTDIEAARKVTEDANARLTAVEAQLASIGDQIARFRAEVDQEIVRDEARIKATLEEESARIVTAAEQEISLAAAQAKRGLRHFAADLAIDHATQQLVLTPETDRALIAEFVGDVTKGGQN
jgi:F-type H+-transporting ATPase subunit b